VVAEGKKYLPFDTLEQAKTFIVLVNDNMGYPIDSKTTSYTKAYVHPTNGTAIVIICPKCHSLLTQEQFESLKDLNDPWIKQYFPEWEGI